MEVHAAYQETMAPNGFLVNLQTDYGVPGKGFGNDSEPLQKAIDDVSDAGGGWVYMPVRLSQLTTR